MKATFKRIHSMAAAVFCLSLPLSSPSQAQGNPAACAELASRSFSNTTIASAAIVAAGAFESPAPAFGGPPPDYSSLPAFCRVIGSIHPTADSDIRFELWLPSDENWNGRFMQTGNGAAAGSIVITSLPEPLSRGYAVANTDTGHQGPGASFDWAAGQPERLIDYQYRAVHELTVVGKAITAARYGRAADTSVWLGCSTGGRQGLMEAQRYPEDYDAIVAGAPANNWAGLISLSLYTQANVGPSGLGTDKMGLLKEAAIAACDADDGIRDRVIGNIAQCGFDPASLRCDAIASDQCLSETEVAAARRLYAGVVNSSGEVVMPGTGPGSEPLWAASAAGGFTIGMSWMRNVALEDPDWNAAAFDPDTHPTLIAAQDQGVTTAMDPDISAFVERGGKLIVYHGTTDGLIPYQNTINYYESVVETLGADAAGESARFYLVPGMDHCAGGEGAFAIDWLSAMESWMDSGEAPGALAATGTHRPPVEETSSVGAASSREDSRQDGVPTLRFGAFARPACAYPEVATYKGSGDENEAASFDCQLHTPD